MVALALNLASLEIFEEAGMEAILAKQHLLTGYLEALLNTRLAGKLKIITPFDPEQRGCQLSLVFNCDLNQVKSSKTELLNAVQHEKQKKNRCTVELRSEGWCAMFGFPTR